jgi:hypothetical protein
VLRHEVFKIDMQIGSRKPRADSIEQRLEGREMRREERAESHHAIGVRRCAGTRCCAADDSYILPPTGNKMMTIMMMVMMMMMMIMAMMMMMMMMMMMTMMMVIMMVMMMVTMRWCAGTRCCTVHDWYIR